MFDHMQMIVADTRETSAGMFDFLIPLILILVLYFWLMHRSQKKKEQGRRDLLDAIRVGDDVVTIGGLHGRVTKVNEDTFEIRINAEKDVRVRFNRNAVSKVLKGEASKEDV